MMMILTDDSLRCLALAFGIGVQGYLAIIPSCAMPFKPPEVGIGP